MQECVFRGLLPTLTSAVLCKAHEHIVLLPLGFYSFNLSKDNEKQKQSERGIKKKNKFISKELLCSESQQEQRQK